MQYAVDNGIISLSCLQEQVEMAKRQEALKNHKNSIWLGSDGNWWTHVRTNGKLKKIKRKHKEDLERAITEYYFSHDSCTFLDCYQHWRSVQDQTVSHSTISRYETDFKRFFEQDIEFTKQDIQKLNEEDVKLFLINTINRKRLCKKAAKTLFGYLHNTMISALVNGHISKDPMQHMAAKDFYKYCTEREIDMDRKVVSPEDMKKFYDNLYEGYRKNPEYIPAYAVEMAILTGMRVGELSALKWDSITDSYIIVDKSEKYDRLTKEYFIDTTKNGKERIFPLTAEIKDLLARIKKAEITHGFFCEWVFADANGRIHSPVISSCVKNRCRMMGITERGIHAFRRTLNSKLRCSGVSATVAASLLGHTEDVNEKYYTFDVSSLEQKTKFVENAQRQIRVSVS